ncbi:MAG: DUF5615 family PIN-like protein [Thermoanaerobaculia bacterium]
MKFLADEGFDGPIVEGLRASGHEVLWVAEMDPGLADEIVLSLAHETDSVLLTTDRDFGELVFRRRMVTSGVVLVRLAGLGASRKAAIVEEAIASHGDRLRGAFASVTPSAIRIRR